MNMFKVLQNALLFLITTVTVKAQTNPENCTIELSFVLDASDSISPAFFNDEKLFINALVNKYTISSYGNKASVALFSDKAVESIYCDQYQDEKSFKGAVLKLEQIGRYTNIEDGIIKGQSLLTKRGCGNRPNVIKIMIILTDGNANIGNSKNFSNGPKDLAVAAKLARDFDITVFAVAVGSKINMQYLLLITNDTNKIIKSSSFDQLLKTSPLKNLFPNCIFNTTASTNIISSPNSNSYATQTTKLENISTTLISNLSKLTTNNNEILDKTKNLMNQITTTLKSNPIPVTRSTFKQLPAQSSTTSETTPKKAATSTDSYNISSTLIFSVSEPSTHTTKQSITTEKEAANTSSAPSPQSSPATVTSFSSKKSTKESATWSEPKTKMSATSTESENISSTLIFTGSESLTHSTEQLVTTEEIANTSSAPSFESTPKHVTGSTSKQLTKESAKSTKTTTKKPATSTELENVSTTLMFTGSEPSTRTTEQSITTEEEAANISSAPSSESNPVTVSSYSSKTSTKESATWSIPQTKMLATSTESEKISSTLIFTGSESLTHTTEQLVTTEEIANTSSVPLFESTPKHVTGFTSKQLTKESATSTKATPKKSATSTELENVSTTLMFTGSEPSTRTNELFNTTEEATITSSVETTEVLRLSTESYVSSSSIPFSKNCRYEVAFVLDASDSINPTTFNDEKLFVGNLVKNLGISENGNKVSVVLFSSKATEAIYCDEYQDEKLFNRALKNLTQSGQFTNIEDGVDKGKNILQKRGCGVQADALKLMVVFTDGAANIGNSVNPMNGSQDLANAAKSARDSGIKIIAVAVGKKVESDVLLALTNDTDLIVKGYSFNMLLENRFMKTISEFCSNKATHLFTGTKTVPFETSTFPSLENNFTFSSQVSTFKSHISTKVVLNTTVSTGACDDLCRCLFNVSSFPKLELSKSDIEAMFNGTCFNDKLLASIKYVSSMTGSILFKKYSLETCRDEIRIKIKKKDETCVDKLLDRFSECNIVIDCKIKDFYERAKQSKKFLENLVKFSEKSYDIFTGLSNLMKWIGL